MNIHFNSFKYSHTSNGNINILFINSNDSKELFFDGGFFKQTNNCSLLGLKTFHFKDRTSNHTINNIKETEDFDFILQIDDEIYLKIFYIPDEGYDNGVIQTFSVYYPSDLFYNDIVNTFEESIEINIV